MLSFFRTLNLVMLFSLMVCGLISSRFRFFKLRVSVRPSTGCDAMETDAEGEAVVLTVNNYKEMLKILKLTKQLF